MRPKAETRSVLRRAVSSARTRKVSSVWCVHGDQQEGHESETWSVLRRAVSSARSCKVSSVWYVPGDQQEGPLPSHCCCGRRCRWKGAPSIEKPPEKEQGLWARWKAKGKSLQKKTSERLEGRCHNSKSSFDDAICKVIGGDTEYPLQVCQLSRSSESTHFACLRRDVASFLPCRRCHM